MSNLVKKYKSIRRKNDLIVKGLMVSKGKVKER